MLPNDRLVVGNAHDDGAPRRGWFVARFLDPGLGLRCRLGRQTAFRDAEGDFELKLFHHPAGDHERQHFPANATATTVSVLIAPGDFAIDFCDGPRWQRVTLRREGDYALWAPGVGHRWRADAASTVLTVRCPAVDARDQSPTDPARVPDELRRLWSALDTP